MDAHTKQELEELVMDMGTLLDVPGIRAKDWKSTLARRLRGIADTLEPTPAPDKEVKK